MVNMIASDAHTTAKRSPQISDALPALESAVGKGRNAAPGRPPGHSDDDGPAQVHPVPAMLGPTDQRTSFKLPWHKRLWECADCRCIFLQHCRCGTIFGGAACLLRNSEIPDHSRVNFYSHKGG